MLLLLLLLVSFLHSSSSTIKFDYLVNVVRPATRAGRHYQQDFQAEYFQKESRGEKYQDNSEHYQEVVDTDVIGKQHLKLIKTM